MLQLSKFIIHGPSSSDIIKSCSPNMANTVKYLPLLSFE